jgi:hypothetical protein
MSLSFHYKSILLLIYQLIKINYLYLLYELSVFNCVFNIHIQVNRYLPHFFKETSIPLIANFYHILYFFEMLPYEHALSHLSEYLVYNFFHLSNILNDFPTLA